MPSDSSDCQEFGSEKFRRRGQTYEYQEGRGGKIGIDINTLLIICIYVYIAQGTLLNALW